MYTNLQESQIRSKWSCNTGILDPRLLLLNPKMNSRVVIAGFFDLQFPLSLSRPTRRNRISDPITAAPVAENLYEKSFVRGSRENFLSNFPNKGESSEIVFAPKFHRGKTPRYDLPRGKVSPLQNFVATNKFLVAVVLATNYFSMSSRGSRLSEDALQLEKI